MEHWNHKSLRQHRFQHRRERQNPSFSSSLLDQIYHSIDQLDHQHQPPALAMKHQQTASSKTRRTTTTTSSSSSTTVFGDKELDIANFQRACLIEKWMDQKKKKKKPAPNSEKTKSCSAREFSRKSRQNGDAMLLNSSSSSSDSSCGGLFSSDTETNVVVAPSKSSSSSSDSYTDHRPKPIRTSTQPADQKKSSKYDINIGGGFVKTKSKALKIYSELKKARRQPISPGGKLANFLNSIFISTSPSGAAASAKKSKYYEADDQRKSKSAQASTCSSATSFSRSCLSKTPTSSLSSSTQGKTEKRSVGFSPVSKMIVNQQDKYVSNNTIIREKSCINEEISIQIKEKNRRVEEAARNLLANYQKKVDECQIMDEEEDDDDDEDEDDDDDGASCASSDLFELDNLSSIGGIERYCKELPVYETTYLDTNRPIATGFIL